MEVDPQYLKKIQLELAFWEKKNLAKPKAWNRYAAKIQAKINGLIPQKVHNGIKVTVQQMVKGMLFGAMQIPQLKNLEEFSLVQRELLIKKLIDNYSHGGAVEGAICGAGGFMMSLADFPALIAIKIKLLFDVANYYGFSTHDYKERLFLLYVFQLAFSNPNQLAQTYQIVTNWEETRKSLPDYIDDFDWHSFQQEYRDYLDLAKMAQLLPIIGSAVGAITNYNLLKKLGMTAMNAYRMRILKTL
ncbi:MAG: EcsC family protein [Pedobacter sp.]|nr:MAG: EcsC family protein [Pedobacter sp.]